MARHQHRSPELDLRHHPAARQRRYRRTLQRVPHRPQGARARGQGSPARLRRCGVPVDTGQLGGHPRSSHPRRRQTRLRTTGRAERFAGQETERRHQLARPHRRQRRLQLAQYQHSQLLGQHHRHERRPRHGQSAERRWHRSRTSQAQRRCRWLGHRSGCSPAPRSAMASRCGLRPRQRRL
ncbi:hypothetical protein D9M71_460940 [compost metagenome]